MSAAVKTFVLLSDYPAAKIIVDCDKCGIHAKYDKLEMLEVGGDRPLPELLDEIARRKGCNKVGTFQWYDKCRARYSNIMSGQNAYKKAKGS